MMGFLQHSRKKKSKKQSGSKPPDDPTVNNVLASLSGVSILALETLQDVARFTPVPYLSDISSAALKILEAVRTYRGNKEAFRKLCSEICDLICTVHTTCDGLTKNDKPLPDDLQDNLKQLLK
ncbi:hypothetical protein PQX77_018165 [Marasmius sp. AFHP31]|nr:hypothetical protein PQX77_018165 [Marasmius sp. AFHP31]